MFNGAGIEDIETELLVLVVFSVAVYTIAVCGSEK